MKLRGELSGKFSGEFSGNFSREFCAKNRRISSGSEVLNNDYP